MRIMIFLYPTLACYLFSAQHNIVNLYYSLYTVGLFWLKIIESRSGRYSKKEWFWWKNKYKQSTHNHEYSLELLERLELLLTNHWRQNYTIFIFSVRKFSGEYYSNFETLPLSYMGVELRFLIYRYVTVVKTKDRKEHIGEKNSS